MPLRATIRGGNRAIAASSGFVLDASKSIDPNGLKEAPWYQWECSDAETTEPCTDALLDDMLMLPDTEKVRFWMIHFSLCYFWFAAKNGLVFGFQNQVW